MFVPWKARSFVVFKIKWRTTFCKSFRTNMQNCDLQNMLSLIKVKVQVMYNVFNHWGIMIKLMLNRTCSQSWYCFRYQRLYNLVVPIDSTILRGDVLNFDPDQRMSCEYFKNVSFCRSSKTCVLQIPQRFVFRGSTEFGQIGFWKDLDVFPIRRLSRLIQFAISRIDSVLWFQLSLCGR